MALTERQAEYKEVMQTFYDNNDQFPPVDTLAVLVGITPNAAHEMLLRFEEMKLIEKNVVNKWKRGKNW